MVSKNKDDSIEFTLNNVIGFSLIGKSNNTNVEFDVYIDDKLYQIVNPNSTITLYNQSLFDYKMNNKGIVKVKIVNKIHLLYI